MELYLAIRVIRLILSSRRLFDDISSSCPLARVLSLFVLDLLTIVPDAVSTLVVPGVMLTRKVGPRYTIPGYMASWGSMAMIAAGALNFGGQLATRVLLGAFEAGFAASLIFYLTTFYTRAELGKLLDNVRC